MPRVRDAPDGRSRRRPHNGPVRESAGLVFYCASCDKKTKQSLPSRLSEFCDCDQYTRWICFPCRVKEEEWDEKYFKTRSVYDEDVFGLGVDVEGMITMTDGQFGRYVSRMFELCFLPGFVALPRRTLLT